MLPTKGELCSNIIIMVTIIVARQCKMPPGVTDRDLLQYMWVKKDESTNTTFVVFKDATHPKIPERKDFIR